MSAADVFLLVVRWLHLVAAAAWIGGNLFYLVVLRPSLRKAPESAEAVNAAAGSEFRALVDASIVTLIVTGVILMFNRLTPAVVGVPYVAVLAVKVALSVWMFLLVRGGRRSALVRRYDGPEGPPRTAASKVRRAVTGYNTVLVLGLIVFLLSDLLKVLFENAIAAR